MPGEALHTLQQIVKIDGRELAPSVAGYIRETVVDDRLQLPAYLTITFDDIPGNILDQTLARIGSKIEFSATPVGETAPVRLFMGEVTAMEASYVQTGAQAVLRAYDMLYRLQRGRHTQAYQNITDSDLARKIAQRNGLGIGKVDPTTTTYEHVAQANVSDWDFLKARARKNGYEVAVVDGKFEFRKPTAAREAPPAGTLSTENPKALVYSQDLLEFHPRLTAGSQVKTVKVRAWDPTKKQEIVGQADATAVTVKISDQPGSLASATAEMEPYTASAIPLDGNAGESKLAAALAEELGSAFFEADGIAIGDPRLKAGTAVSVSGVASKFAGGHVLSHVRHVFENEYGYRTHFEISGRQERSLLGLTSLGDTNGQISQTGQPIYGLVVGIVTNIKDDKKNLRIKVTFPWLAPKTGAGAYESTWARLATPGAGPNTGVLWVPEVDDEVLVGFEHGDIHRPYILGGLYNGKDLPNLELDKRAGGAGDLVDSGKAKRRGVVSRKGHRMIFVDDDQASQIAIKTSDGKLMIEWDEKKGELRITGNQKVIVTAEKEMTLESKTGDMNIRAKGSIKLEGNGGVDMKSNASFKVQGSTVDVKGSGPVSVSGATVKLG
jgi:phage protein D/phage baseplate assembly protein gpV